MKKTEDMASNFETWEHIPEPWEIIRHSVRSVVILSGKVAKILLPKLARHGPSLKSRVRVIVYCQRADYMMEFTKPYR